MLSQSVMHFIQRARVLPNNSNIYKKLKEIEPNKLISILKKILKRKLQRINKLITNSLNIILLYKADENEMKKQIQTRKSFEMIKITLKS